MNDAKFTIFQSMTGAWVSGSECELDWAIQTSNVGVAGQRGSGVEAVPVAIDYTINLPFSCDVRRLR